MYSSASLTRGLLGVTGSSNSTIRDVVVGNDVKNIQTGIFSNFTELTSVDMSSCSKDSVEVPERCFEGCIKLESIKFPNAD